MSHRTLVVVTGAGSLLALIWPALREWIAVSLLLLCAADYALRARSATYPRVFLTRHVLDAVVVVLAIAYQVAGMAWRLSDRIPGGALIVPIVVLARSGYYSLRLFASMRRTLDFLLGMTAHPAQTIVSSFAVVIAVGTGLLMMPATSTNGEGLEFLEALFTATSAVCVTGLIVVDTATAFTPAGQIVILLLIQIGGLGIIILSYFARFLLRGFVGVEDHVLLAYTLSESDLSRIGRNVKRIVLTTFGVELAGAILLFAPMYSRFPTIGRAALASVFHSVSAFCNAGFALFTDSLEGFAGHVGVNVVVAALIVLGGLSFAVLDEVVGQRRVQSANSKVVLMMTGALLLIGFLGLYGLEHAASLSDIGLGRQYLAAFFQSVTLRTAGFNTIPFGSLRDATLVFMMIFMFIGGASGSTAGGIKVNTAAVHLFYVRSKVRNLKQTIAFGRAIPADTVSSSVLILIFGISVCAAFSVILTVTENAPLSHILFETVSAFGTVGLSAGLTPNLTAVGRVVIILLMFMGRLGPLTILAAATGRRRGLDVEYPVGHVSVG